MKTLSREFTLKSFWLVAIQSILWKLNYSWAAFPRRKLDEHSSNIIVTLIAWTMSKQISISIQQTSSMLFGLGFMVW